MVVQPYISTNRVAWNEFIERSINGFFFHKREFMEYHSQRFSDHSLMFFENGHLVGCLPAHLKNNILYSHQGLTFGGLLAFAKADSYTIMLETLIHHAQTQVWSGVVLNLPPNYYHEDFEKQWRALQNVGFQIIDSTNNFYIHKAKDWKPSSKKTTGYRNGKFEQLRWEQSNDFKGFWQELLIPQLKKRHDAAPVHSLEEILELHHKFPNQIQLYMVWKGDTLLAGVVLFDFGNIHKIQYAAANELGFESNAMDFLYLELIQRALKHGIKSVDLGTAQLPDGSPNKGLVRFKKQLGAIQTPVYRVQLTF